MIPTFLFIKKLLTTPYNGLAYRLYHSQYKGVSPTFLILDVTEKCNCRCIMCNIWKITNPKDLSVDNLYKSFEDRELKGIKNVNITGGEVFLRDDLNSIVAVLVQQLPKLEAISISTNGLLVNRIVSTTKSIAEYLRDKNVKLGLRVSVDGLYETHDSIRGVPNAFSKAISTVNRLLEVKKYYPNLTIGTGVTIIPQNAEQLDNLRVHLKKILPHVGFTLATVSETYFQNADNPNMLAFSKKNESEVINFLKRIMQEEPMGSYYFSQLIKILNGKKRTYPCLAGYRTMYMSVSGDVYPCQYLPKEFCFGNIEEGFSNIWYSKNARLIRKKLKDCKICAQCPNNCDLVTVYEEDFYNYLVYLIKNPKILVSIIKRGVSL